jgi:hypothetical protein
MTIEFPTVFDEVAAALTVAIVIAIVGSDSAMGTAPVPTSRQRPSDGQVNRQVLHDQEPDRDPSVE